MDDTVARARGSHRGQFVEAFGDQVHRDYGALFDHVLGLAGRDPGWRSPGAGGR